MKFNSRSARLPSSRAGSHELSHLSVAQARARERGEMQTKLSVLVLLATVELTIDGFAVIKL